MPVKVVRIRTKFGGRRPRFGPLKVNWVECGQIRTQHFGRNRSTIPSPKLVDVGQFWPAQCQIWPGFNRCRPSAAQCRTSLAWIAPSFVDLDLVGPDAGEDWLPPHNVRKLGSETSLDPHNIRGVNRGVRNDGLEARNTSRVDLSGIGHTRLDFQASLGTIGAEGCERAAFCEPGKVGQAVRAAKVSSVASEQRRPHRLSSDPELSGRVCSVSWRSTF